MHLLTRTDSADLTPDAELVVGALHDASVVADHFHQTRTTNPAMAGDHEAGQLRTWLWALPVLERHLDVLGEVEYLHATSEVARVRSEWQQMWPLVYPDPA